MSNELPPKPHFSGLKPEPEPQPAELLAARALISNREAPAIALRLDDIVRELRASLQAGEEPDFETMLITQTFITNTAFNRLMVDSLLHQYTSEERIRIALQAQRNCAVSLNALHRVRGQKKHRKSGKQTDQPLRNSAGNSNSEASP